MQEMQKDTLDDFGVNQLLRKKFRVSKMLTNDRKYTLSCRCNYVCVTIPIDVFVLERKETAESKGRRGDKVQGES